MKTAAITSTNMSADADLLTEDLTEIVFKNGDQDDCTRYVGDRKNH